jgi:hypothetical protein
MLYNILLLFVLHYLLGKVLLDLAKARAGPQNQARARQTGFTQAVCNV